MKLVLVFQVACFLVFGGFVGAMHNRIVELERIKVYSEIVMAMDVTQLAELDI